VVELRLEVRDFEGPARWRWGRVDTEAAAYWDAGYRYAPGETGDRGTNTGLMVRAGLAAVPYLMRRQQWAAAAFMLECAFNSDPSRANAAAVLPAIQEITARDPVQAGKLAKPPPPRLRHLKPLPLGPESMSHRR
jgi:hypothetical protein